MKKRIILFLLCLSSLLITGCEKKEYHLIEITAEQLTTCLVDSSCSITFAFYNKELGNAEDFMRDLATIVKETKENIYFVDSNHINLSSSFIIYDGLNIDYTLSTYVVYQNGKEVVYGTYDNFTDLKKDLNGKKYDTQLKEVTKEEIETNISKAKELYQKGYIAEAMSYLNNVWAYEEAKEEYKKNPYYALINEWESYKMIDETNVLYTGLLFHTTDNSVYVGKKQGEFQDFERPSYQDYEKLYYYVKDDIIYTAKEEEGTYTNTYTILKLEEDQMVLKDTKYQYNFYIM